MWYHRCETNKGCYKRNHPSWMSLAHPHWTRKKRTGNKLFFFKKKHDVVLKQIEKHAAFTLLTSWVFLTHLRANSFMGPLVRSVIIGLQASASGFWISKVLASPKCGLLPKLWEMSIFYAKIDRFDSDFLCHPPVPGFEQSKDGFAGS